MNYLLKAAFKFSVIISILYFNASCYEPEHSSRIVSDFSGDWKFKLADAGDAFEYDFDDSGWENIDLPHDWSIHGEFSGDHPAGTGGGALPGGIGWYRKTFFLSEMDSSKNFFIEFDGIYRDSDVWINGHFLGNRPNGYISFGYELTGTLNFGQTPNIISVKVDNSLQPNSRWYSGSGIYRNVRLVSVNDTYLKKWGAYLTT